MSILTVYFSFRDSKAHYQSLMMSFQELQKGWWVHLECSLTVVIAFHGHGNKVGEGGAHIPEEVGFQGDYVSDLLL